MNLDMDIDMGIDGATNDDLAASLSNIPAELLPPIFALAQNPALRLASRRLYETSQEPRTRALYLTAGGIRSVFRERRGMKFPRLADEAKVLDVLFRLGAPFSPSVLIEAVKSGRVNAVKWFLDGFGRFDVGMPRSGTVTPAELNGLLPIDAPTINYYKKFKDLEVKDESKEDGESRAPSADDLADSEAFSYLATPSFLANLILTHSVASNEFAAFDLLLRHPILRFSEKPLDLTDAVISASRRGHLAVLALLIDLIQPNALRHPVPSFLPSIRPLISASSTVLQSALRTAAARSQPGTISLLLSLNRPNNLIVDPNDDQSGTDNPPLSHAAWRGHADVVRVLLEGGARPDNLSLFLASSRGYVDSMREMVRRGARPGEDLLWYSGSRLDEPVVRFLLCECGVPIEGCCSMWRVGGRMDVANWVEGIHAECAEEKRGRKGKGKEREELPPARTPPMIRSRPGSGASTPQPRSSLDALIDALVPDAPTGVPSDMFDPRLHSGWFGSEAEREGEKRGGEVKGVWRGVETEAAVGGSTGYWVVGGPEPAAVGSSSSLVNPPPKEEPRRPPSPPKRSATTPTMLNELYPELAPTPLLIAPRTNLTPSSAQAPGSAGPRPMQQHANQSPIVSLGPAVVVTAPTPTSATNLGESNREPPHTPAEDSAIRAHLSLAPPSASKPDQGANGLKSKSRRGEVLYFDDDDDLSGDEMPLEGIGRNREGGWKLTDGWVDVSEDVGSHGSSGSSSSSSLASLSSIAPVSAAASGSGAGTVASAWEYCSVPRSDSSQGMKRSVSVAPTASGWQSSREWERKRWSSGSGSQDGYVNAGWGGGKDRWGGW